MILSSSYLEPMTHCAVRTATNTHRRSDGRRLHANRVLETAQRLNKRTNG